MHLGSKLDAEYSLDSSTLNRGSSGAKSHLSAEEGCEWIAKDASLVLPELPETAPTALPLYLLPEPRWLRIFMEGATLQGEGHLHDVGRENPVDASHPQEAGGGSLFMRATVAGSGAGGALVLLSALGLFRLWRRHIRAPSREGIAKRWRLGVRSDPYATP